MSDVVVALKKVKDDYIKSMPGRRPQAAQWSPYLYISALFFHFCTSRTTPATANTCTSYLLSA
jgi:hypothetical protein